MTDAPDLTAAGVEYLAQDASRLGLETKFLTGTVVVGNDPMNMEVICDGDTVPLTMCSTIGPLPPGAQASVLSIGDKGLFIIGSQMQAVSVYTLPDNANIGGGVGGGGGGSGSPATGPGCTAPFGTVVMHDTFNRTVTNAWTNATDASDNGYSWDIQAGITTPVSVTPGTASMGFTAASGGTPRIIQTQPGVPGIFPLITNGLRNHTRWLKNIRVTVPATAGLRGALYLQVGNALLNQSAIPNVTPAIRFYGDGTAGLQLYPTFSPTPSEIPIAGVTAHQPLDIYAEWHQTEIRVWCELTSNGIDPNSAPLTTHPTVEAQTMCSAGALLVRWLGMTNEASNVSFGEITYTTLDWE